MPTDIFIQKIRDRLQLDLFIEGYRREASRRGDSRLTAFKEWAH